MNDSLASSACPARDFDVALLDLDGVVYIGQHVVDHADTSIEQSRQLGMRMGFVTNNAARTPIEVADHLVELGIPASAADVVTSSQAAAHLLRERLSSGDPVLAVGGLGIDRALEEFGLRPVRSLAEHPVAVMQGFGRDVTWRDLAEASLAVRDGAYWVATNLDATFPIPGGRAPGNGMLVAAVAEASGRRPDAVAGKPHPPLMRESVDRLGAHRPLVVGDRLDTDIEGANALGIASLLVLTGVTDVSQVLNAAPEHRPSLISRDLRGLLDEHPVVERVDEGLWRARQSQAVVRGDSITVTIGPGDHGWEDALRCSCAAAWSRLPVRTDDVVVALRASDRSMPQGQPPR